MKKRVAILTGGGDVPGLNMCLRSLVFRVIDYGYDPIGVRKGWEGLINYNPKDTSAFNQHFIELTKNRVRAIDQTPGSFLHSSRIDPRNTPVTHVPGFLSLDGDEDRDLTEHIILAVEHLGQLTYLMRTGAPDGQDMLGATNFGLTAAQLLRDGKFGRMTAFQRHHTLTHIDLIEATQEEKRLISTPGMMPQITSPLTG